MVPGLRFWLALKKSSFICVSLAPFTLAFFFHAFFSSWSAPLCLVLVLSEVKLVKTGCGCFSPKISCPFSLNSRGFFSEIFKLATLFSVFNGDFREIWVFACWTSFLEMANVEIPTVFFNSSTFASFFFSIL